MSDYIMIFLLIAKTQYIFTFTHIYTYIFHLIKYKLTNKIPHLSHLFPHLFSQSSALPNTVSTQENLLNV